MTKTKPALLKGKGKKKVVEEVKVNKRKGIEKGEKSDSKVEVQVKEGALIVTSYPPEIGEMPEEKAGKKEGERPAKRPRSKRTFHLIINFNRVNFRSRAIMLGQYLYTAMPIYDLCRPFSN